ncbi:MAG: hypothetical protein ACRD3B_17120, partial [Candidatus Sulfotelmatobacter sp.]
LLSLGSCARDQKLIGITIQPGTFTFLDIDTTLVANFTAIGTYIHPPENRDITGQVTWAADVPSLINVAGGAVSPTGNGCGVVNVSASTTRGTEAGGIVIAYATVTVDDPLVSFCPGGSPAPILSVVPESTTSTGNSVTSSPAGINCPAQTCGAPFPTGTAVTLTASPSSNFLNWGTTCPQATANVCVVVVSASTSVTAVFQ